MSEINDLPSPCIGVCAMSETTGFCQGCYRTIDEIRAWWEMEPKQKILVLAELDQRMLDHADFGD